MAVFGDTDVTPDLQPERVNKPSSKQKCVRGTLYIEENVSLKLMKKL